VKITAVRSLFATRLIEIHVHVDVFEAGAPLPILQSAGRDRPTALHPYHSPLLEALGVSTSSVFGALTLNGSTRCAGTHY